MSNMHLIYIHLVIGYIQSNELFIQLHDVNIIGV